MSGELIRGVAAYKGQHFGEITFVAGSQIVGEIGGFARLNHPAERRFYASPVIPTYIEAPVCKSRRLQKRAPVAPRPKGAPVAQSAPTIPKIARKIANRRTA